MTDGIQFRVTRGSAASCTVSLSGDITETFPGAELVRQLDGAVVIDAEGIERINSLGVREWISFISQLEQKGARLTLEKVSVAMVGQLNMISNFAGRAQVRSLFSPYVCNGCDGSSLKLHELGPGLLDQLGETLPCPKCGEEMEFDDLPDRYLAFTRRAVSP